MFKFTAALSDLDVLFEVGFSLSKLYFGLDSAALLQYAGQAVQYAGRTAEADRPWDNWLLTRHRWTLDTGTLGFGPCCGGFRKRCWPLLTQTFTLSFFLSLLWSYTGVFLLFMASVRLRQPGPTLVPGVYLNVFQSLCF